jgi:hypothetical protein
MRRRVRAARMMAVTEVRTAHTSELDDATLIAARALLEDVFDDMTGHDWEHALGGMHALVWEGPELASRAPRRRTVASTCSRWGSRWICPVS